jgi:hypothetical protein
MLGFTDKSFDTRTSLIMMFCFQDLHAAQLAALFAEVRDNILNKIGSDPIERFKYKKQSSELSRTFKFITI